MLRTLDLFSGAGMFSLGLERTGGFRTVAFCERDEYARRVLRKHWRGIPVWPDIRDLRGEHVVSIDVICGGFPCQDLSVAGKGAGIGGDQSGLWSEFARLIGEIRPRYVLVENVAAMLKRGLGRVLGDLASIRYDAEWHCIPASAVGAPHNRDRIWIIAYPQRDEQPRPEPRFGALGRMGWVEQSVAWDRDWEDALSFFRRVDDGNARSVDRTDLTRNALVPQIAEMLGRAILQAEGRA